MKKTRCFMYKINDLVLSPNGMVGVIRGVDCVIKHGNPLKPRHHDYWVYFGAARESGYKETELRLVSEHINRGLSIN